MKLLILFFISATAFVVFDDLTAAPLKGFTKWTCYVFNEDHRNRQPNQQPKEWTNVTFLIPDYVKMVQLISCKNTTITQEIPFYCVDELARKL